MADRDKIRSQFGGTKPSGGPGQLDCAAFEQWLAEGAEQALTLAVERQMQEHAAGCEGCREKLERARRGREWMRVLRQEILEPPVDMVAKILAKTSLRAGAEEDLFAAAGRAVRDSAVGRPARTLAGKRPDADDDFDEQSHEDNSIPPGMAIPVWQHNSVVVLRRTFLEPRLALVAAMAFFSITLTLNLMGVRLTNMHVADLQPGNLGRAVTRQYAETNARFARYYENLRIVYEVESRVQQLKRAAKTAPQPQQTSDKQHKRSSNSNDTSGDRTEPHRAGMTAAQQARGKNSPHASPDPLPVITGPREDAAFRPAPKDKWCAPQMKCFMMGRFSMRERRLA
jgi:hypothetical protein